MNDQTSLNFVDPERVRENLKAHLAKQARVIQGKQLALHDGRLVLGFGDNRSLIADGEKLKLTIGIDYCRAGFISWQGIKPAYRVTAFHEGPPLQLEDMPDRDPALWPLAKSSGKAYDPWSAIVLLLALDEFGDFFTVTYLDREGDEFPEIYLAKSTAVLSPKRQVDYIAMPIIGWESRKAFVDLMKPAGIKIASVMQATTPKQKTALSSSPPETEPDDRWWDRQ